MNNVPIVKDSRRGFVLGFQGYHYIFFALRCSWTERQKAFFLLQFVIVLFC